METLNAIGQQWGEVNEKQKTASGLWKALDSAEEGAQSRLENAVGQFEPAVMHCYEAGVEAPTLGTAGQEHLGMAALFLKKALTDLRSVWLLLERGYTAPAASVAASLWENALSSLVIAADPNTLNEIQEDGSGDLPWPPRELSRRIAASYASQPADSETQSELEVYGPYKWLCKIKHPTLRSAVHEAGSTKVGEDYVVLGAPDIRDEDLPVKAMILLIVLHRLEQAITGFVDHLEPDPETPEYARFSGRIQKMNDAMGSVLEAVSGGLPYDIADEKVSKEYRQIRRGTAE